MSQPLARIGQRFTSQFIDGVVALAVGAVIYMVADALNFAYEWLFLGWLSYILLCDGLPGGQSLGKRVTKTAVVHVDTEQPCTYVQSVLRNLILVVLGVLDVMFIVGKQRRRLGDFLARTKVVQV